MYIENPDEEQNKQQSSSAPSIGAGGGGASVSTGGNPSTIQPVQTNQPNQSFANIQDYLKANQQQGEDLGNKFVSTISPGIDQAKSAIDTSAQNTQGQIASGTVNANPDIINTALKTPTAITGDKDKLAEFQKEYNAQYTGPTSFESSDQYTNAANAANTAKQTGQELSTTGGREQLLQDQFGVYGQGNKGLDQGILQNSSAYSNVPPLAQGFKSVQDYLNAAANTTNTAATNAANTTAATAAQTQGAFVNNLTNFQNDLNTRTKAAQDAAASQAATYTTALQSGDAAKIASALQNSNLTDAQRNNLQDYLTAINKDYGANPDLTGFYNFNPQTAITTANVANPEDYANAAAYKQLTGTDYSGVLNPANATQAGTMINPNTGFNADQAGQSLQQYLIQKETEVANPQNTTTAVPQNNPSTPGASNTLNQVYSKYLSGLTGTLLPSSGIANTIGKLGTKLSDSLGIGAKHTDVNVTLPKLTLPNMAIPQGANAATTKLLTDVYNTPIKDTGSYHEGAVLDMNKRLDSLQAAFKKGDLTQQQYTTYATPLAQWANSAYKTILGSGHTAGKTVEGNYPSFQAAYGSLLTAPSNT